MILRARGQQLTVRMERDGCCDGVVCHGVQHSTAVDIPQLHRLIKAATGQDPSVGMEGDAANRVGVPAERMQQVAACLSSHVPQAHCAVNTATSHRMPVGTESTRKNPLAMAAEYGDGLAAPYIPYTHGRITTGAQETLPIGAELDGFHIISMAVKYADGATAMNIPQPDRPIAASAGQGITVSAIGDCKDPARVALKRVCYLRLGAHTCLEQSLP